VSDRELLQDRQAGVLTLTINRPKARNALTGEVFEGLLEALRRAACDRRVRAVALTGAGGAFCAGGDVGVINAASSKSAAECAGSAAPGSGMEESRQPRAASPAPDPGAPPAAPARDASPSRARVDVEGLTQTLRGVNDVSRLLWEMPKPTIAVIPGPAAGAGLSLALACDMRIATRSATLTTAFARLGLSGDLGGSYFLTQLVGPQKARELYFTSEILTAEDAVRLGIVNHAYPDETFAEEARSFVARIAALPTVAIGYMKRNINAALHATLSETLDVEAAHMVRTLMTEDHRRGIRAFLSRTDPEFSGD
jgi:2-(1,2-epoxy-1,2-dihydrophenyl)acetyl-CoA isomerase